MNIIDQLMDSYAVVNNDLVKLSSWAKQWLVCYNAGKTVSLHITRKNENITLPALELNGIRIKEVDTHCHLGVEFERYFSWLSHILKISGKGSKCVGLMRRACRDLPRKCLETLYTTMVRPILEYGGVLFDGSPDKHLKHLDKVQREAALVCTGAYKHTKNVRLNEELGWATLTSRRCSQRLCMMYKMQNNIAPVYLTQACPPLVGELSNYNLRNTDNIVLPLGKKAGYFNSFMPRTVRDWNSLDRTIRNRDSLDSFKYNLKKKMFPKKTKLYSMFDGAKAVHHTRMRLGLSGLKAQRHAYNHVQRPNCDFCGAKRDDVMHYFLQCNVFTTMRTVLMNSLFALYRSQNIVLDLTRTLVKKQLADCLMNGDKRLNERDNIELFRIVQQYICSSKRFI
jgi:hypothetical protein